jgi:cystathionine gamma-synthase/methionine-gamma-lyase
MSDHTDTHGPVHPRTAVLTRGFDPSLSFGSARPAVFRSSTYVFASPEAAERAFQITHGKIKLAEGERADLIYSRISHANAEILPSPSRGPTAPSSTPPRCTAAPPG